MKSEIDSVFNQQQTAALKQQIWWVGDQIVPYMVKATVHNKNLLIMITNLQNTWVVKKTSKQLWQEKDKYARTLEISNVDGLLKLFSSLLINPEKKAQYTFKTIDQTSVMRFQVSKDIQVYPFLWKFNLQQKSHKIVQVFCQEIMNPLIYTLNAQQRRISLLKRKFQNLEKDYLKRLSESEKNMFKSQTQESPEDWKILMPEINKEHLMDLRLDASSRFFFQSVIRQEKNKKNGNQLISPKAPKIKSLMQVDQHFEPDQIIRVQQLQKLERQTKKAVKKKIDFI